MTEIREVMWRKVGLFRNGDGLAEAVAVLDRAAAVEQPQTPDGWRLRNLVTVARLIARAALGRDESRGAHFRADCPARDDQTWMVHVVETKDTNA